MPRFESIQKKAKTANIKTSFGTDLHNKKAPPFLDGASFN